jgi:hypothetical protein
MVYDLGIIKRQRYIPPSPGAGGTITTINTGGTNYTVHTFTSSGVLIVPVGVSSVEYLVVAGGGGGAGQYQSGGGGAGGVLTATGYAVTFGSPITVTVGAGGTGGAQLSTGTQGANSVFGSITAIGGGFGGSSSAAGNGGNGGSGGGAAAGGVGATYFGGTGVSGPPRQGYDGGAGAANGVIAPSVSRAGGGGGAGGAGASGVSSGNGGIGILSSINGTSTGYAGGGGGGSYLIAPGNAISGYGGGGGGAESAGTGRINAESGTPNTGGGGGGVERAGTGIGGAGGSGIVIVRYPASTFAPSPYDTSFTATTLLLSNQSAVTSFASDVSANTALVSVLGDTRSSTQNPFNFGYYSNFFNGSTDYILVPYGQNLNLQNSYTIEAWIYPTTVSGLHPIFNIAAANGANFGLLDFSQSGSALVFQTRPTTGGAFTTISSGTVTANTWQHVAASVSNTSDRLFLNGTQVGSTTTFTNFSFAVVGVGIGGWGNLYNTGTEMFQGYISNLRVVNGVAVYTGNFTPPTAPLGVIQGAGTNISAIATATNVSLLTCQSSRLTNSGINTVTNTVTTLLTVTTTTQISSNSPFPIPGTITSTPISYSNYFNGVTDYLSTPTTALGNNSFTIEAWVYPTSTPGAGGQVIVDSRPASTNGVYPFIYFASNLTFRYYVSSADRITSSVVTLNSWYHVAVVRSSGTTTMYLNGVLTGTPYVDANTYITSTLLIGAGYGAGAAITNFFAGYMSNLRVVNGTGLYTTTFVTPTLPLTAVANTNLLTAQSNQFIDGSTNNYTITLAGNPRISPLNPFLANNSLNTNSALRTDIGSAYFDGDSDYVSNTSGNPLNFGLNAFTVELWFNMTTIPATSFQVLLTTSPQSNGGFQIYRNPAVGIVYGAINGSESVIIPNATFGLNRWYHIAVVRTNTGVNGTSVYVDGARAYQYTDSNNYSINGFNIGGYTGSLYFPGYISNVRVVKGSAVYPSNFLPPTQPLTAISGTALLTLQTPVPVNNRTIIDSSSWKNVSTASTTTISLGAVSPYGPNWSTYFNGSTDVLSIPTSTAFDLGTGNFTIEMWVNRSGAGAGDRFLISRSNGADFMIRWNASGVLQFYIANSLVASYTWAFPTNTWYHLALVRNSSAVTMYIDGISVGTGTNSTNMSSSAVVLIGGYSPTSSDYFNGYISNLRIIKGQAIYTSTFNKPTSPLNVASGTSLLACSSNRHYDVSGVSTTTNFTVTGSPGITKFTPFSTRGYDKNVIGGSVYLNGTTEYIDVVRAAQTLNANWTMECYFYATGAGIIADCRPATTNGFYPQINVGSATTIGFFYNGSNNSITVTGATYSWNHIAVVKNSGTIRVYFNGVSVYSVADANSVVVGVNRPRLGANGYTPLDYFPGYISDFRLVNGTAIYTANFTPPPAPLKPTVDTAVLLNMTDAAITDASMLTNLATIGDAKSIASVRKFNTNNIYFDGAGDYLNIPGSPSLILPGDFTIEMWIYPTNVTGTYNLLTLGSETTARYVVFIVNGALTTNIYGSVSVTLGGTISINTWTHVAVVRSGSTIKGYLNGTVLGTTDANSATIGNINGAKVGSDASGASVYVGYIDDLRITKGLARYTANFTVPSEPPKLR